MTVLACCAPYVHMLMPNSENKSLTILKENYKQGKLDRSEYLTKKREITFFGYSNQRKLWYAIGKPIAMLYLSVLLMYSSFYINEKRLVFAFKSASILGTGISFYFIVWAFWYRADFPEQLYFIVIGLVALFSTYFSYNILKSRNLILSKIKILTEHIVVVGKKHVPLKERKKYVEDYLETFDKIID